MPDLQTPAVQPPPQVGMQPHFIESAPAIKEAEQQTGQIQQGLEQKLQPLEQQRTQIETSISSAQPPVSPPKLQDIPQFQPRQVSQEEMQQFGGISMALAGLVSLATRRPLTTALSTAASAMKGFNDGNFAQAKLDLENFNAQSKAAVEQNNKTMQEYNAILQNQQFTFQQKVDQLRVVAQREQDEIGLASLKKGDIKTFLDANMKRIDGFNRWQAMASRLSNLGYGQGVMSKDAVDNAAAYFILNGRLPIGMSRMGPMVIQEIQNRAAEMTQSLGMSPEEFAAVGPITRQKLGSLLQLEKMRNAVQAYESMLDLNVNILKDLSDKVTRTDSPYFNRSLLWLKNNAAGDPDVAEYLFQVNTVSTEIARVLNNPNLTGQLTDTARNELQGVVSGNLSPEQMNQVLTRAQQDARNRSKSLDVQSAKVQAEIKSPLGQPQGGGQAQGIPTFATEAEAAAANLKPGTRVKIGNQTGTWH